MTPIRPASFHNMPSFVRLLSLSILPVTDQDTPQSDTHVKRPFSLNSSDFYPLVQIRSLKWMAYDEKTAYRAKHGVPRTIDEWIANGITRTKAPTIDLVNRGPCLKNILWQDDVECILSVIHKEVSM